MSKSYREDLTGQRFGRLTVIEFVPNDNNKTCWKCKCDCGNTTIVWQAHLKNGHTKSCGCLQKEKARKANTNHGLRYTRLYMTWRHMKERCYNSNSKAYKDYGGRGITICDEWKNDFKAFYDWAMTNGYDDSLTIDRIDNDKGYFPENCRWVDKKIQGRNKRNNVIVEYQGKKICLAEASELSGINYLAIQARYERGDRGERLFRPVEK